MSKAGRRAAAAARDADRSWSVHYGKRDAEGNVKHWRKHIPAYLGYRATAAEYAAKREEARLAAKAKAKALTEDPDVVWVTVYPPVKYALFNLQYPHPEWAKRIARVSKWTRRKGWWQEGDEM